jgi:hypothetical protein
MTSQISRRTVARGAAWTAPIVAVAVAAPAVAASIPVPTIKPNATGGKCPGQSTDYAYGFVIPIETTGPVTTLSVTNVLYNGTLLSPGDFCVAKVNDTLFVVSFNSTSSANGVGGGSFDYTVSYGPGGTLTASDSATFSYNGTNPIRNDIRQETCTAAGNCA